MSTDAGARIARIYALVPCAGVGVRACTQGPKQYVQLAGRAMVAHTLAALQHVPRLHAVLVMLAADDQVFEHEVPEFDGERAWIVRNGGTSRADTVANGLDALR
ncbi:MAG TPA: 2-C-methyl-D-erythritol 4-phosphate cytidylyltransferase, partial [Burkholderiaceae bacterium]|nr:2-C-methyl-D-erythritol 4-phosphate cytidylyltransferase [Burkholderiaceae bacterium]